MQQRQCILPSHAQCPQCGARPLCDRAVVCPCAGTRTSDAVRSLRASFNSSQTPTGFRHVRPSTACNVFVPFGADSAPELGTSRSPLASVQQPGTRTPTNRSPKNLTEYETHKGKFHDTSRRRQRRPRRAWCGPAWWTSGEMRPMTPSQRTQQRTTLYLSP